MHFISAERKLDETTHPTSSPAKTKRSFLYNHVKEYLQLHLSSSSGEAEYTSSNITGDDTLYLLNTFHREVHYQTLVI